MTELFFSVVKVLWACYLIVGMAYPLRDEDERRYVRLIYYRVTAWTLVSSFLVIAVVIATSLLLMQVPGLSWSWLKLFGATNGANIGMAPMGWRFVGPVIMVLFVLNIPLLAHWEEMTFRVGTRNWGHGVKRSVGFGLLHCVVGVPIGVGLALSIAGLWYTRQYFLGYGGRDGVTRATVYHTAYNLVVVSIFALALLLRSLLT